MLYSRYEVHTFKRVLKYLLGVIIILWAIVTFVMGYFYIVSTGTQISKKGGTFVEGIFNQVSYLPYLRSDEQSTFYQSFLFGSCVDLYETDEEGNYLPDLCEISSEDDKVYQVSLTGEAFWNDGMPVSIDDVFFTYDEIIRQNKWGIASLSAWANVSVALENGAIKVEFPISSPNNATFFTQYILPKHSIANASLEEYRNTFSLAPVYAGCASIVAQTKDINSLIFDLSKCEDTHLGYYQLKTYQNFEEFEFTFRNGGSSIVDVYQSPYTMPEYSKQNMLSSQLMGVFFNTNSDKVKVRLRRSLGGLINSQFFTGSYQQFIRKYQGEVLSYYLTDGENVGEFINRVSLSSDDINTQDLQDSGAKELPTEMSINGVDRKFTFFTQKFDGAKNLEIKFSNEFENIKITGPDGSIYTPPNYKKADKKLNYKLTMDSNIKVGSNQFTISGYIKGKTYTIASIDIYVFEALSPQQQEENQRKLNVLFYSEPSSIFVAQQLREIFRSAGILENFIFEEVFNPEELEGKLLMGTYDIYIGSVELGSRSDILALFNTEEALQNPSRYRNPILTSLIRQYTRAPLNNTLGEINNVLAQDMPLVLLGRTYTAVQMKDKIAKEVFSGVVDMYAYEWRHEIYANYALVHNTVLNPQETFDRSNFFHFIKDNLSGSGSTSWDLGRFSRIFNKQENTPDFLLELEKNEDTTAVRPFNELVQPANTPVSEEEEESSQEESAS